MQNKLLKEDILRLAAEEDVKFIRLQFTDIFGTLKNIAIPVEQLGKALNNEMMFDGSSIEGFVRIDESDMYLFPDPGSFVIYPWIPVGGKVARLICDVYKADQTPFSGCPRNTLRRALRHAEDMGYTFNVGPEAEFFLFHVDANGKPTTETHDKASYFDLPPVDMGENARRAIVLALQQMGYEIEASHHEGAPGQHEIDFKYGEALDIADKVATFRMVVRRVAQDHNLHATFMPKPIFGVAGSGMHMNMSLCRGGENIFCDESTPDGLSQEAYYFIGGLLKHAKAITAITNPCINSYKRLVSGYEAPVYIAWSEHNRSPLVRIPSKRGSSTRIELRSPDPSCNPYLALAVALEAGLDGIRNKIDPPPPCNHNIYEMNDEQLKEAGIDCLPADMYSALLELQKDEVLTSILGEHFMDCFSTAKKIEWDNYRNQVHQWEIDEYLTRF